MKTSDPNYEIRLNFIKDYFESNDVDHKEDLIDNFFMKHYL